MAEVLREEYITADGKTVHIMVSGDNNTMEFCPYSCSSTGEIIEEIQCSGLSREEVQAMIDEVKELITPCSGLSREEVQAMISEAGSHGSSGDGGQIIWESDWFDIKASGTYDFEHNLNLEEPWKCMARIIGRVKVAAGGWMPGEVLFCDGCNYIGSVSDSDFGWVIAVATDSAHVSFGNFASYIGILRGGGAKSTALSKANIECKLVISY